jgi:hypothetical protein
MNERTLLRALDADLVVQDAERGWVNCICPLAPWTHAGGVDTRPSFGISLSNDGPSFFYCFGCMDKPRELIGLIHAIHVLTGGYPWDLAEIYTQHENHDEKKKIDIAVPWERDEMDEPSPLPKKVLTKFPLLQGAKDETAFALRGWMETERGIPEWVQNMFRLRYDPKRKAVVFPLTDHRGRIYVMRERRLKTKQIWTVTPKISGYPDLVFPRLRKVGVWFGMFMVNHREKTMLVEGEFDAMRVAALGYLNVMASATSSVTDSQIGALKSDQIILGYDDDKSGHHAHSRIRDWVGDRATYSVAKWGKVGCKDGGDLRSREQLMTVLERS